MKAAPVHSPPHLKQGRQAARPAVQTAYVSHAAERLADAIVTATAATADPRTLSAWGQEVGVSRGTLRVWCRATHTQARACLDFMRLLRAVQWSPHGAWDLFSLLNVIDERSLGRLLDRGRLRRFLQRTDPPSVDEFLAAQRFVEHADLVHAVSKRLAKPRR
jgi:hypothetical protein